MPKRITRFIPAILFAATIPMLAARAAPADDCAAAPKGAAPEGQHWYYYSDPATHHKCWFLGERGTKVHAVAHKTRRSRPIAADPPAMAPAGPPVAAQRAEPAPAAQPVVEPPVVEQPVVDPTRAFSTRWPDSTGLVPALTTTLSPAAASPAAASEASMPAASDSNPPARLEAADASAEPPPALAGSKLMLALFAGALVAAGFVGRARLRRSAVRVSVPRDRGARPGPVPRRPPAAPRPPQDEMLQDLVPRDRMLDYGAPRERPNDTQARADEIDALLRQLERLSERDAA
jgi:hypothetical protein